VVQGVVDAALEFTTDADQRKEMSMRLAVGKLLSLLVPGRVVTREQLSAGIATVMVSLPDLVVDFPKAEAQLTDLCSNGLVKGTLKEAMFSSTGLGIPAHDAAAQRDKGYVDVGHIAPSVAAKLPGVNAAKAGALLPKEEPPVPPPAPAPAAAAPPAAPADDDDDAPGAKKVRACAAARPPPPHTHPSFSPSTHQSRRAEKEEAGKGSCGGGLVV
jgi:hypothetical protein